MSLLNMTSLIMGTNPYYTNLFFTGSPLYNPYSTTSLYDIYKSAFNNNNFSLGKNDNWFNRTSSGGVGNTIVDTAKKYIGYNEKDGSYKKFTNGRAEHWCADFATYVTKEAFRKNGKNAPSWFGSPSVQTLMNQAKNHNCFLNTQNASNKATTIANKVNPGDIVIFKNGRSHTGVVKEVYADGSFETIEGNTSKGTVATRKYSANEATLSGFVQLA